MTKYQQHCKLENCFLNEPHLVTAGSHGHSLTIREPEKGISSSFSGGWAWSKEMVLASTRNRNSWSGAWNNSYQEFALNWQWPLCRESCHERKGNLQWMTVGGAGMLSERMGKAHSQEYWGCELNARESFEAC